jgi:ABC-type dipeptide/oligopeptide/nickel transport system permease component
MLAFLARRLAGAALLTSIDLVVDVLDRVIDPRLDTSA